MKRKILIGLLLAILLLSLSGCGCEHQWAPATCLVPETCTLCGKTQGKTAPHSMEPATCLVPATCSVCGITEGEPADFQHVKWTEANYQQGSLCVDCGAELAPPLTPDFEIYGLSINMELGVPMEYMTRAEAGGELLTTPTATAEVTEYKILDMEADAAILDEIEARTGTRPEAEDGYEWRFVRMKITATNSTGKAYTTWPGWVYEDYYNITGHDDSLIEVDDYWDTFDVSWNGELRSCQAVSDLVWGKWKNHVGTADLFFAARVPIGYDGYVVGVRNYSIEWGEGQYIFDLDNTDTLLFRMD